MPAKQSQSGFSALAVLFIILVIAALAGTGFVVYQRVKSPATATLQNSNANHQQTSSTSSGSAPNTPNHTADSTATWVTYHDTGKTASTGITIKLPSDWEIVIPGDKSGMKPFGNTKNPVAVIGYRSIFLANSETPEQEWHTCATNVSADACGAAPGDKTVSGSTTTINGLAAYTATMQNAYGTYHVAVIKSNKATSPAGTAYVEFTIHASDPSVLATFNKIMATATFAG